MDLHRPVCSVTTNVASKLRSDAVCTTPRLLPPRPPQTPRRDDPRVQPVALSKSASGVRGVPSNKTAGGVSPRAPSPTSPRQQTDAPVLVPHAPRGQPTRSRPNSRQGSRASSRPGSRLGSQPSTRPSSPLGSRSSSVSCIESNDDLSVGTRLLSGLTLELTEVPEDGITEEFLQSYCDGADLASVSYLHIQVDTVVQNVDSLGAYVPNLRQLRLSNSSIISIRELGIGLENLEVLWMSRCGLQELEGITVLHSLQELYLPFNDVADVTQLKWLEHLSVLDLEGNALVSLDDVDELRRCYQVRDLTLKGNPVCNMSGYSRDAVLQMLPQITVLDDVGRESAMEADGAIEPEGTDPCIFLDMYLESDMPLYLDFFLEHGGKRLVQDGASAGADDDGEEISALSSRCQEINQGSVQPALACADEPNELELVIERLKRPEARLEARARSSGNAQRARPTTTGASGTSGQGFTLQLAERRQEAMPPRPASSAGSSLGFDLSDSRDAASDLTRGGSLAGNPLAALRHRRTQASAAHDSRDVDVSIRDLLRRHSC